MRQVHMLATGAYLPGDPIDNEQIERLAGPLPDDILEGIQVKTRHWIADPATGEQREKNSDLAYKAGAQALERAGLSAEDVELLVVSTASPDYHLPPVATYVQDGLGLRKCASIDIRSGCAGAVEALDLARMYLERGSYKTALVIGSEAISTLTVPIFLGKDPDRVRMRDRLGIYNFGDGAGAMLLQASDDEDAEPGLGGSAIACVGGGRKAGMQVVGGGTHEPIHKQLAAKRLFDLKVDVVAAGTFTPHVLTEGLVDTLARAGVEADAIDCCVIPEGNATYMTDELREAGLLTPEWLSLEPKIFENLTDVGATGSAAVPLALDYAWTTGTVSPGDTVMLLAIETSKWKYAGLVLNWDGSGAFVTAMQVDRGVEVTMRDGVVLRMDVYRPEGDAPAPVILSRTCYNRRLAMTPAAAVDPERAVAAGFATVCQDVRGQHGSDGDFDPFVTEGADGFDTIEWIASQPWCNGAVGLSGRSYVGATQWLAAAERPAGLKAIAPVVTGSNFYHGWVYQGGAFQLGFNLFWVHMMGGRKRKDSLSLQFEHLPLKEPPMLDEETTGFFYRRWLEHSADDAYWRSLSINQRYDSVTVPALNVGGWYDVFLGGTLENFRGVRERPGTRLVIGPWAHGSAYGQYPDHSFEPFGGEDKLDLDTLQLEYFAAHLRGGEEAVPRVRLFVMGANVWRDEDDWPLARAQDTPWYLHAGGGLALDAPVESEPDGYVYDPLDAAPTLGGPTSLPGKFLKTNAGPEDQRPNEERADVLVYSSGVLEEALEVTGPLTFVLWAATSAPDTDFVVKLCDVEPDGTSRILAEGVIRTRFRAGDQEPRLIEPGAVLDYRIDMVATSNVFLPGHRIRVNVTSSSFPRFDRNTNTGHPLGEDRPEDVVTAQQTIFHDPARPSHIVLPVVSS